MLRLRLHFPVTFQHWAGVSPYTSSFDFAETCVFGKQSLGPLHCGPLSRAPLLPKLRGHFAEFLNKVSPVRLRIFSSPTCVGLRYGRIKRYLATFLASLNSSVSAIRPIRQTHPFSERVLHCAPDSSSVRTCPSARSDYPSVSLHHVLNTAREYQPAVHHLRLSPST